MIDKDLNFEDALQSIGVVQSRQTTVIPSDHNFVRSLHSLHSKMGKVTSSRIGKYESGVRIAWKNLGIPDSIDKAGKFLHEDIHLMKSLTAEWGQNAVEHGAGFKEPVEIETIGGTKGVLVSIQDNGKGIPSLEEKLEGDFLYDKNGYETKRGFGLKGAHDAKDVQVGFETNERGFKVLLLLQIEHLEMIQEERKQMRATLEPSSAA